MWFKIKTDFMMNKKINIIKNMPDGYAVFFTWLCFLAIATDCNKQGRLYFSEDKPYTREMLASALNLPVNLINFSIETFKNLNMLAEESDENGLSVLTIKKYEEYQNYNGIEKAKELNRQRVSNYREKQKLLSFGSDKVEQEVYELYKSGYSLRDIGKKFGISKNTAARIIKKIENLLKENGISDNKNMPTQETVPNTVPRDSSNAGESNNEGCNVTGNKTDWSKNGTQLSHKCPTSVPEVSHKCPTSVPQVSLFGTVNVPITVPNAVPRDSSNAGESNNEGCNVTSNVPVMSRNALRYKNIDIDKDLDLDINTNTEEDDMRIGENRLRAKTENKIIFNSEKNELEVPDDILTFLKSVYADLDLNLKLKEISVWLMAHPEMVAEIRSSDNNFMRFVVKWLMNEKNKPKKPKHKKYLISFDDETASFVGLTEKYIEIMKSKFQAVDIDLEIKKMESWLLNNPAKRPAKDYMRFINSWLTREQNKISMSSSRQFDSKKTFADIRTERNMEALNGVIKKIRAGEI